MELFVYLLQKEKPARYLLFLNDFMCFLFTKIRSECGFLFVRYQYNEQN